MFDDDQEERAAEENATLGLTFLISFFVFCWICS